jgi:hypothetical protein
MCWPIVREDSTVLLGFQDKHLCRFHDKNSSVPRRVGQISVGAEFAVMAGKILTMRVNKLCQVVDSLGPAVAFRKMHGILNALEMQVEDGDYKRHAVTRLCEALLSTAELYDLPEKLARQLEEAACAVVTLVEDRR